MSKITGNELYFFLTLSIIYFFFYFFFWIFLILNRRNFLTFHHTRVFLPSSHENVLIFELFRTNVFFWILPCKRFFSFFEFLPHKGFKISNFTTQGFKFYHTRVLKLKILPHKGFEIIPHKGFEILPHKGFEIIPHKGFQILPHKGFENVPHKGFEIYTTQGF